MGMTVSMRYVEHTVKEQKKEWEEKQKLRKLEIEVAEAKAYVKAKELSKIGSAAIKMFDQAHWTVSGNVFSKSQVSDASFMSYSFGPVVVRLTMTISSGPTCTFDVGIISSKRANNALTDNFSNLNGGGGWDLYLGWQYYTRDDKQQSFDKGCEEGRVGQRIVLEADGREAERSLKLSQDGKTQPRYYIGIPVPFRFAVYMLSENDAVEIESVEVLAEPQMVGGKERACMGY
ncbi:hypothetical protein BLNAU_18036 [Blattamonas nauphoetae]|uniref:Uncharacterized protein n=1 Tax=Blattamonas nauphoetae TaxID=2049346 RepID=A0ABQ9X6U4_9EUKA|nr:hypothetical protein BLNAU_18036 [Blattamonas nauphoetae]